MSSRLLEQYMGASGQSILIYTADHSLIYSIHMEKLEKLQDIARSLIDTVLQSRTLSQTRTLASRTYYLRGTRITWESQDYVVFEIRRSLENKVTLIPGVIIKNQENISTDFYSLFYDYLTNPDFLSRAAAYSEASNPVMIIGESGTGKSRLADFVYSHSPYRQSSLVLIDCKQLDKRGLHLLFQSSQSPLYEYGITLYLKEINLLKRKYTEQLVDFLMQSTFLKKNKMIFSVTCSLSEAGEDRLCQQLISRLNAFPLYLSPLRDRAGDIPKLCLQYLNQLNQNSPKQVTGFDPEAMNYLQSFYWDENVKQLKRVLEELFAMTRTPYICAKDVVSVLRENKGAPPSSFCPAEEGPLTLDQIIQKGVRRSLIANQMNHTKTAKELGISRTALWRLLKKSSNKRGCEE